MRIPLDYYRILGLPLAASNEQLQQAYRDRTVQLPRREYSEAAIAARKQILEEAYAVLSDSEKRSSYDERYLAQTYEQDTPSPAAAVSAENRPEPESSAIDPHTPSIEIADEQFVGALLILQELGEYELVLKLGRPYLINRGGSRAAKLGTQPDSETLSEPSIEQSDIVLTVALACLELGREQWQQGQYENAAVSLETGQELLLREGLFPSVRGEIQADLYKLRPYRILELLALPEENSTERRQGLQLLQNILQERGGIDGAGEDQSGLNIDDFLRFIQQLRSYLTAAEQQKLFEVESKRPSAVATYLAVYALIARGFAQRQPALIRQAKHMLMRLGKRQDVHLEQAVCALLLGQTEEASRALELSQEYEPLAFIRENSQGSPDLLPGLCLYGERWLQTEVFPHFRDLANQQASLKDYFADEQVQAYLEALPTEAEPTNEWAVVTPKSLSYVPTPNSRRRSNGAVVSHDQNGRPRDVNAVGDTVTHTVDPVNFSPINAATSGTATATLTPTPAENGAGSFPAAERIGTGINQNLEDSAKVTIINNTRQPQKARRRSRGQRGLEVGSAPPQSRGFAKSLQSKTRLVWLVFGGLVGILLLLLLASAAYGWLRDIFFPAPTLQGEQLLVQLDQPPLPIPDPNSKPLVPEGPLTEQTAEEVVQTWLNTKASAFGSNHYISSLEQILVGPALAQWQRIAQQDQANNRYRQYKHGLRIESVEMSAADPDKATVVASVSEAAEYYEDGQINQEKSYDETLRVRYYLVRIDGLWRIREMTVLR